MNLAQSNIHAHNKTKDFRTSQFFMVSELVWLEMTCDWVLEQQHLTMADKIQFLWHRSVVCACWGRSKGAWSSSGGERCNVPCRNMGLDLKGRICGSINSTAKVLGNTRISTCSSWHDLLVSSHKSISCSCAWGEGMQETVVNLYYSRWKREGEEHLCVRCYPAMRGHLCRFDICSWSLRRKR
jgi:hypothetical protein